MNPTAITYPATGAWRRVGHTIVITDAFPQRLWEHENGGGGAPPAPWKPSRRQQNLLKQFLGHNERDAQARLANFRIPPGLSARTLRWYEGIALAALANLRKASPRAKIVQPLRLQLVRMALQRLG